jgi:hypothetical protein
MKNLLCWLPSLRRPASILYTPARLGFFNKITLSVICLGSLLFLIGGLTAKKGVRSREQWLMSLTGLFGFSYVGLDLLWHFYVRFLQSRAMVIGYYFAWHLVGGIALGMFLYVGFPKGAKFLLTASAILFVAFNVFVIVRHLASATLFLCLGNSLVIGVLIPSGLVLWLYQPKTSNQSGNG